MRNRDFRGRFIKNTKPQKEDETSTQRAIETETEILGEETVEQNPEPEIPYISKLTVLVIQPWMTQLTQRESTTCSRTLTL
jgi:hypothetical protein